MLDGIKTIVAVVGCQRSGTTLVGQILGAHPNAALMDEFDGLYAWFSSYGAGKADASELWCKLLHSADQKYLSKAKRVQADNRLNPDITHLILKAPNLTFNFQDLASLDLPVQVIYPHRDVRSVVASMGRLSKIPFVERQLGFLQKHSDLRAEFADDIAILNADDTDVLQKRALIWKIKSSLAQKFSDAGLPVFSFKYEDLVIDPDQWCRHLAKHAGLVFHTDMVNHQDVYTGTGPGGTERFRAIDQSSLKGWQSSLDAAQQSLILDVAQAAMQDLGYDMQGGLDG